MKTTITKKFFYNYVNGGHFIISENDINVKDYEERLVKFFNSKELYKIWNKRRKYTSYQFDERFMTMLFIHNNCTNKDLNSEVKMFIEKDDKIKDITIRNSLKSKKIIHICNGVSKSSLYKRIANIIEEEKQNGSWRL